jgi:NAD(P)H-dependent FMN reductase
MLKLQIIIASTRPARQGSAVAQWTLAQARTHGKFDIELIDLRDVNLPLFDEPRHPRLQQYEHEHTKRWSASVARGDAFVFVTPEYDHAPPSSLVNAFQFVLHEWAYKAAAFVSYGGVSAGTRGVQVSKQISVGLKMMPMFETVAIPFFAQHIDKESGIFAPPRIQEDAAKVMLDELHKWATALKTMRAA